MARKIHTSPTGSKYIIKNGKKLYGAPMMKVLASEGHLPKKHGKTTTKRNPKNSKNGFWETRKAGKEYKRVLSLESQLAKAKERLRDAETKAKSNPTRKKNVSKPDATHTQHVRQYWRELPASDHLRARRMGQQDLFADMQWARNPRSRGRMVFNPETEQEEFIVVPERIAEGYELFQGKEVEQCVLIEAPAYFPDEVIILGEMPSIDYITEKGHINAGEEVHYTHKTGEEGGERPLLCADEYGNLLIVGGDYTIHAEGIRN
jgi:hypothetical protein